MRQHNARDRADLLTAYPNLFPSCQALLHILESTDEGRTALQELRSPLHRLQYLRRTVRQYEQDLDMLGRPEQEWQWEPYLPVGLRWRPGGANETRGIPQQQQGQQQQEALAHAREQLAGQQQGDAPHVEQGGAATDGFGVSPVPGAAKGAAERAGPERATSQAAGEADGSSVQAAAGQEAPGASDRTAAATAAAAAAPTVTSRAAAVDAAQAAAALAAAAARASAAGVPTGRRALAEDDGSGSAGAGEGSGGEASGAASGGPAPFAPPAGSGAAARPLLRVAERVLRGRTDAAELKAELEVRRVAAESEAVELQTDTDARLERLRELLRTAASAVSNASAAGIATTDITADPNDLELYDLLLAPCAQAQLDPSRYESYPPRPLLSFILPYTGRRLPYIVDGIVEPLLACAAGGGEGTSPSPATASADAPGDVASGSGESGAAAGDGTGSDVSGGVTLGGQRRLHRRRRLSDTSVHDGASGGQARSAQPVGGGAPHAADTQTAASMPPQAPAPLPLELIVAFDEASEAADWATVAAESGGRVVPLFRPAGAAAGAPPGAAAATGVGVGAVASAAGSVPPPPLLQAANRLAAVAHGEMLVLLQDGDPLPADTCDWLRAALAAFRAWPRLGALGSGAFVMDWHPGAANRGLAFWDEANELPLQFVTAALSTPDNSDAGEEAGEHGDYEAATGGGAAASAASADGAAAVVSGGGGGALLAVRRSAWLQLRGLDAGLGSGAADLCGPCAALDLSTRLWLGGWQVAHMPTFEGPYRPASRTSPSSAAEEAPLAAPDPAWCERLGPDTRARLETACARQLQLRYGRSPFWEDREERAGGGTAAGGDGRESGWGAAGGVPRSWFLGSELHVRVTEHVARLNLGRLQRLAWGRWECPFGAIECF